MTSPSEPNDSRSSFEQQLKQLKPVPATGLEEMLYQAGWQAGHTAALVHMPPAETGDALSDGPPQRRRWTDFVSGAASGLVAASLLFLAATWSGWVAPSDQSRIEAFRNQIGRAPAVELTPRSRIADLPAAPPAARGESTRQVPGLNLFAWLDSGTEALTQAIKPLPSQFLTTAPIDGPELDRLLSLSADVPAEAPRVPASREPGQQPEILRYRLWDPRPSEVRF